VAWSDAIVDGRQRSEHAAPESPASACPGVHQRRRVVLDGVALDGCSEHDAVVTTVMSARAGRGGWIVTVNVDILRSLRRDAALRRLVSQASLVVADGMPLVWAARLRDEPLAGRVTGASLIFSLVAAAAEADLSVYLLGGPPGSAAAAADVFVHSHPALRVVGTDSPPMGFEGDATAVGRVFDGVVEAGPDIVFCGLGFPKQEQVILRLRRALPCTWFVGCGAAIAFASGFRRRAPDWMQDRGLEWVHRLGAEPRRLFRRYVIDDAPYATAVLARSAVARVRRQLRGGADGRC
jgi:N-acetylglucosaminyldiphosphoundecaprenol N-acetyl-beta-D-mannosaminyltransferase